MGDFKQFFEIEFFMENGLRSIIGGVPQRPDFHREGPVGAHSRMVRRQLDNAMSTIQRAAADPNSALSSLDVNYSPEDINILRLAAWLHDLGKASATTIDGKPWKEVPNYDMSTAKITGKKHEMPHHFNPMARQLLTSPLWKQMFDAASFEDKKTLWFLIRNHMDIGKEGLGKRVLRRYVGRDGKYINDRRIKLLLTLILMDRLGRADAEDPGIYLNYYNKGASKQAVKLQRQGEKQSEPGSNDPVEFLQSVGASLKVAMKKYAANPTQQREFLRSQLTQALKRKSAKEGLNLTDDSIAIYVNRYLDS